MELRNKKGEILIQEIVFLVLNLVFLGILVIFIFRQGAGAIVLEELYAKQLALLIDSAEGVSILKLDVGEGLEIAKKNGVSRENIFTLNKGGIRVKLTPDSEYKYSFFNNVSFENGFFDKDGMYILSIFSGENNG